MQKFILFIIIIFINVFFVSNAQEQNKYDSGIAKNDVSESRKGLGVGGYVQLQTNNHTAAFKNLPGIPNCCDEFSGGNSVGYSFGAIVELPIINSMPIVAKFGLSDLSADFTKEKEFVGWGEHNGAAVPIYVNNTIETNLLLYNLSLGIDYYPVENYPVKIGAAFESGFLVVSDYSQKEELHQSTIDNGITYYDTGNNSYNEKDGAINNVTGFFTGLSLMVGWRFDVNEQLSLHTLLSYTKYFNDIVDFADTEGSWNIQNASIGISVIYSLNMIL